MRSNSFAFWGLKPRLEALREHAVQHMQQAQGGEGAGNSAPGDDPEGTGAASPGRTSPTPGHGNGHRAAGHGHRPFEPPLGGFPASGHASGYTTPLGPQGTASLGAQLRAALLERQESEGVAAAAAQEAAGLERANSAGQRVSHDATAMLWRR